MIEVAIADEQANLSIDYDRLKRAVTMIFQSAGIENAAISIAIVDDPTIHDLNRRFLEHDYPTDVLSFVLERDEDRLEGEVIVSADYAVRSARDFGWSAEEELLLYVIHGTLHLAGYDDQAPTSLAEMRERETHFLAQLGVQRTSAAP